MIDNCINKVISGRHVTVIGETGGGKTFWMADVANKYLPLFIFVNPQLEKSVEKVCEVSTTTAEDVKDALEEGYSKIEFIPPESDIMAIRELTAIRKYLFDLGFSMDLEEGQFWINLIIDEADIYAGKMANTDIINVTRRGRRVGVRGWFLTRRPQELSSHVLSMCKYQIIFDPGSYQNQYFSDYHIPIIQHEKHLKKQYYYVVWDSHEMMECEKIHV